MTKWEFFEWMENLEMTQWVAFGILEMMQWVALGLSMEIRENSGN
jgi:hypothetical protein